MNKNRSARGIPLQLLIAASIVASMLVLTLVLVVQGRHSLEQTLVAAATDASHRLGSILHERAQRLLNPAKSALSLLRHDPLSTATTLPQRLERLPVLIETLDIDTTLSAIYVGYSNGDFLLVRTLRQPPPTLRLQIPGDARYLVQSITHDARGIARGEWRFYDRRLQLLTRQVRPDYRYDPRTRPWYLQAALAEQSVLTHPYVFFTTGEIGISLAQRSLDGRAVIGMDASVQDLGSLAQELRPTPGTQFAVLDDRNAVFVYSDPQRLLVQDGERLRLASLDELQVPSLAQVRQLPATGQPQTFELQGQTWYGIRLPLDAYSTLKPEALIAIPQAEMFVSAQQVQLRQTQLAAALTLLLLLAAWWLGRRIGKPLHSLAKQMDGLADFDFSRPLGVNSNIREVRQLSLVLRRMATAIHSFQSIALTLNHESRLDLMLENVLQQLVNAASLSGGAVYLFDEASHTLALANRCGSGDYPAQFDCTASADSEPLARLEQHFAEEHYLCLPLRDRGNALLGGLILRLTDAHRQPRLYQPFRRFVEELSGAAAVAIETRQLIESQQRLLDAIIQLLADAIDAKSPYTGGHCERVPQLATMLLEQAIASQEGSFADFHMNDAQRYEFHIAAWLHDCGKITSPEHVVDKATKLETLYNRLHEVRTRFEVLWRDAELSYWQGLAAGGDAAALQTQLHGRQAELQEEFAFVARCNIGGESMNDADIQRLQRIAERRWWRHFDDRLGLSHEEARRLQQVPPRALPAEERLLADRPEHLQPWGPQRPPVEKHDPRNIWGFDMQLPAYAFNYGELHNLQVRRGTLTEEERFKINEHIVQTLILLGGLPFPRYLKNVPNIAANHHEKMDGSGYPRRLRKADMSLPERIMAVADIFEALTAADRPYKPAKPLSESLRLMAAMAREGHIDSEVFRLFLVSGVYREYAARFLAPEQIDHVDVEACLAGLPHPEYS